jgi:hypothetical protein
MDQRASDRLKVVVSWALVSVPLAWGVLATLKKALLLFQ